MKHNFCLILSSVLALSFASQARAQSCKGRPDRVQMIAVGDIIFHGALHTQAMVENHGWKSLWNEVQPLLSQADLVYGNLEGPAAAQVGPGGQHVANVKPGYDDGVYAPSSQGKSLVFNFHPSSVQALKSAGFDIFSLANNHTTDRGSLGVDRTIGLMEEMDIKHYGTGRAGLPIKRYAVIEKNGMKIGFVGCTYGVQGSGGTSQVMLCYRDSKPNPDVLAAVREVAKITDIVALTPHWGQEYSMKPNEQQKALARAAQDAGARLILGHHPHVLQPMEVKRDQNGEVQSITAYSLGNWVTNQMPTNWRNDPAKYVQQFPQRASAMLLLSLEKRGSEVRILSPSYVPVYMAPRAEIKGDYRTLLPAYPELYKTSIKDPISRAYELIKGTLSAEAMLSVSDLDDAFGKTCRE